MLGNMDACISHKMKSLNAKKVMNIDSLKKNINYHDHEWIKNWNKLNIAVNTIEFRAQLEMLQEKKSAFRNCVQEVKYY